MIKFLLLTQLLVASLDTGKFVVNVRVDSIQAASNVIVNPLPITRVIADLSGPCNMFMFSDSSFVLRTFQKTDTMCIRKFNIIPSAYRKESGYYQKRADTICLLSDRDIGCTDPNIFTTFTTFSMGWNKCFPTERACGTETTVMDFNAEYKERYENGAYWCASRFSYGPLIDPVDCYWSGWVYPLRGFPGRWETADNWLFFMRK